MDFFEAIDRRLREFGMYCTVVGGAAGGCRVEIMTSDHELIARSTKPTIEQAVSHAIEVAGLHLD